MELGDRLKSERERLGMNQRDFAGLVAASKSTQIRWESGETAPGVEALRIWIDHGVDVLFVLTGMRSFHMPALSHDEVQQFNQLVDDFDACSDEGRETALMTLSALRSQAVAQGTSRRVRSRSLAAFGHGNAYALPDANRVRFRVHDKPASDKEAGATQTFNAPVEQVAGRDIVNKARGNRR